MVWRSAIVAACTAVVWASASASVSAREVAVTVVVRSRLARTGAGLLPPLVLALVLLVAAVVLLWRGRTDAST